MRRGGSGSGCLSLPAQASAPLRRKSATELHYPVTSTSGSISTGSLIPSRSAATSPVGLAAASLLEAAGNFEPGSRTVSPRQSTSGPSGASAGGATNSSAAAVGGGVGKTSNESWVCPDDRQLALRAKLKSGWSIKTANLNQWKQPDTLSEAEHQATMQKILDVISQAEQLEKAEQERVGRLIDRLETLRQSRLGNGDTDCILCGEVFSFFNRSQRRCAECAKLTCSKCGLEAKSQLIPPTGQAKPTPSLSGGQALQSRSLSMTSLLSAVVGASNPGAVELIWLCKICHEQREIWKKSGAWFFKSMPKYVLPEGSKRRPNRRFSQFSPASVASSQSTDNLGSVSAKEDCEISSEEEGQLAKRLFRRSLRGSVGSAPGVFSSSMKKRASCGSEDLPSEDDLSLASTTIFLPYDVNSNGQSFEVQDSDDPDGCQGSRSRSIYHDHPEARSSSVPPTLIFKQGPANGQSRTGSPLGFRGGRPPIPPGVPRPPHWPPRTLGTRYCRTPPGFHPPGFRPGYPPPLPHQQWRGPGPPPPFRSPSAEGGSPPFSPRIVSPRRGGPPCRGMRYPRPPPGPPRFRHPYPPQRPTNMPFSAPQSPVMSRKFVEQDLRGCFVPTIANDLDCAHNSEDIFHGSVLYNEKMFSVQVTRSPSPPSSSSCPVADGLDKAEGGDQLAPSDRLEVQKHAESDNDDNNGGLSDVDLDELPKTFHKARPFSEHRENKFTSTLRRLSTVRKRTKMKRRDMRDKYDDHDDSSVEATLTTTSMSQPPHSSRIPEVLRRASSTTSRDSEIEALTSGYLSRQESQSHGSDETLSSPRSPEGSHGLIEFSLVYKEAEEHLLVNVIKAKKIKGTDINGLADSYCKITLVPPLPNKAVSQQITKTVAKSVNPHYNAMLHFSSISRDILMKTSLCATLLDEDLAGDLLLAEAKLPLKKILPQTQMKFQVTLEKPDLRDTYDGLILNSNVGAVEVSLAFYSKQGTLKVGVKRCIGLQPAEGSHTANPVVQVTLLPGNKKSNTHRTTVKWNSLSPEFHEQFVFLSSITELPKQSLHISVWDKLKGSADEYMGGVILGLGSKSIRLQHWMDMMKTTSQFHTRIHFLSANFID